LIKSAPEVVDVLERVGDDEEEGGKEAEEADGPGHLQVVHLLPCKTQLTMAHQCSKSKQISKIG
jgi:hypothetical protein